MVKKLPHIKWSISMNNRQIKKKSWPKPTKLQFTFLNKVKLTCFVSVAHFQQKMSYFKGQKCHSRRWADVLLGGCATQMRRVRPKKLLPLWFIMMLLLRRSQQRHTYHSIQLNMPLIQQNLTLVLFLPAFQSSQLIRVPSLPFNHSLYPLPPVSSANRHTAYC